MPRLESDYATRLCNDLLEEYPGAVILKNDASYIQGIPDRLILFNDRWGMLETKRERRASRRPNQEYYVDLLNRMSFAAFIDPENEEEVLHELAIALRA